MSDPAGPARSPRRVRGLVTAVAVASMMVAGCGPSEDAVALVVDHPQWVNGADRSEGAEGASLRFDTECADVSQVSVEVGVGVDGVPLVTVLGQPRMGRCRVDVVVSVPADTTRIEDAATGMVVDLPAL